MTGGKAWPPGLCREIAVIDIAEDEAVRQFGVNFRDDRDDLDDFRFAFVQAGGRPYALQRYRRTPSAGLTLLAMDDDRVPSDQIDHFLSHHGFDRALLRWIVPDSL